MILNGAVGKNTLLKCLVNKNQASRAIKGLFQDGTNNLWKPCSEILRTFSISIPTRAEPKAQEDHCEKKDVYQHCPLCPAKGFKFKSDKKSCLKCDEKQESCPPKPVEPIKKVPPPPPPIVPDPKIKTCDEKKAGEKSKEVKTCGKPKPCAKPEVKKGEPPKKKEKVKTATDCTKDKTKKEPEKKCEEKKSQAQPSHHECETCSVAPWPFSLLKKKKKAPKKSKSKQSDKKKMVAVANDVNLSTPLSKLSHSLTLLPRSELIIESSKHFHSNSHHWNGNPVCPPIKKKPCGAITLSKQTLEFMAKLRAVARARRRTQCTCDLADNEPGPCNQPLETWQKEGILIRSPEEIKTSTSKKVRESPRLIPRKLRKKLL